MFPNYAICGSMLHRAFFVQVQEIAMSLRRVRPMPCEIIRRVDLARVNGVRVDLYRKVALEKAVILLEEPFM